jgi:hypothetical protein
MPEHGSRGTGQQPDNQDISTPARDLDIDRTRMRTGFRGRKHDGRKKAQRDAKNRADDSVQIRRVFLLCLLVPLCGQPIRSEMKTTNFDRYLAEQLRDPAFAKRFKRAGEAWDAALRPAPVSPLATGACPKHARTHVVDRDHSTLASTARSCAARGALAARAPSGRALDGVRKRAGR